MKKYVQLKDGVVFAELQTEGTLDTSNPNIVEVENSSSSYLYKKQEGGSFIDAEKIRYAIIDEENNNTVIGFQETYFSSDVNGVIVEDPNVRVWWTWDGTQFNAPVVPESNPIPELEVSTDPVD